jgi:hypothetical protein
MSAELSCSGGSREYCACVGDNDRSVSCWSACRSELLTAVL